MPALAVAGTRLHHEEQGAGDPILCIHGMGSSARVWAPAFPVLARLGRVIAYDRRGCTRSERPDPYERVTVAEHADDAAALLEALGAVPAVVIGRSYGGEIAIDLTLRHPDRVRALVLLEGAPAGLDPDAGRWWRDLAGRALETAAAQGPAAAAELVFRTALGDDGWESLGSETRGVLRDNGPALLAEIRGEVEPPEPGALAAIACPTLLVSAEDSPAAFRRADDVLHAAIPRARRARVGGGHFVDPAAPPVLEFVREVLGGA